MWNINEQISFRLINAWRKTTKHIHAAAPPAVVM